MMKLAQSIMRRIVFPAFPVLAFLCAGIAEAGTVPVHAYYLTSVPTGYEAQEAIAQSLRNSGANTLVIDLPLTSSGAMDQTVLPSMVFFAHHVGLRIFIVLPVRKFPALVEVHPAWEDLSYDPATGAILHTGKLDLFNRETVDYLAALAGEAASYSIDGIFLGSDLAYGPFEGMSRAALTEAEKLLGQSVRPRKMYLRFGTKPEGTVVEQYGALFHSWTEIKRNRMLETAELIRKSVKSANTNVIMGMAVPIAYPVASEGEMLASYAFDMNAARKQGMEFYWMAISERVEETQRSGSYRQFLEVVSRAARSMVSTVKDRDKTMILLPVTGDDGKLLPLSEIEEATGLVRQAGGASFGYVISPGAVLPKVFSQKMFRR